MGVPIPETAERAATADNTVLPRYRHPDQVRQVVLELVEPDLTGIHEHLRNLSQLQQQEIAGGASQPAPAGVNYTLHRAHQSYRSLLVIQRERYLASIAR